MSIVQCHDTGAWQASRSCPGKPNKDENGLTTIARPATMLASPVLILASLPKPFIVRKSDMTPRRIESLEDLSRRPRHLRQPTYSVELVEAVVSERGVSRMGQG